MDTTSVLLQISIVGVLLSAIMEAIKAKFGPTSTTTKMVTIGLALALGAGIFFFSGTPIWIAFVGVLGVASTVYAFLLK